MIFSLYIYEYPSLLCLNDFRGPPQPPRRRMGGYRGGAGNYCHRGYNKAVQILSTM